MHLSASLLTAPMKLFVHLMTDPALTPKMFATALIWRVAKE